MDWLHRQLLKIRIYSLFIDWTKVYILPGFSPLPLYTVAAFFLKEIQKEALLNKASSLAYNFMLAIFPAIIFLFALIPFLPNGFQDQLMAIISLILPHKAFEAFESTITEIVKIQNGKLLSFGILFALIFATNGVDSLMMAFNKSSLIMETRTWFERRLVALVLTLAIFLSIIICMGAMIVGEVALKYINSGLGIQGKFAYYLIQISRWALLGVLYFVTISVLYRYGPSHAKKWKLFSAGSWLATILAFLSIWGFSFYINNFGSYNKLYGSIGTLIVIMIWLYLNSLILLIGFELNASVDLTKRSVKIIRPNFNVFKKPSVPEEKFKR